jgi:hypothetical protein
MLVATTTNVALEAYIRVNAGMVFHPMGMVAMRTKAAKWDVVDLDLDGCTRAFSIAIFSASTSMSYYHSDQ